MPLTKRNKHSISVDLKPRGGPPLALSTRFGSCHAGGSLSFWGASPSPCQFRGLFPELSDVQDARHLEEGTCADRERARNFVDRNVRSTSLREAELQLAIHRKAKDRENASQRERSVKRTLYEEYDRMSVGCVPVDPEAQRVYEAEAVEARERELDAAVEQARSARPRDVA
jgi:hypothetical protein